VLTLIRVIVFNIHDIIIYSALSIPIFRNNHNLNLNSEHLKILQKKLDGIKYLVINKKSMVEQHILALIDLWLCQAFFEHQNHVFGDCSIILVSDFR